MENEKVSSLLQFSPLLLVVAASGFLYWNQTLVSSRPPEPDLPPESTNGRVRARLWQDPLRAARKAKSSEKTAIKPAQDLTDADRVLAVMIHGGYSGDDHEKRLRTRYAVLAALDEAYYVPESTDELPFTTTDALGETLRVPYEWMRGAQSVENRKPRVLLIWLDASRFGSQPFQGMCGLLRDMGVAGKGRKILVLGPLNSDGLKAMLDEKSQQAFQKDGDCAELAVTVFSPRATISERDLKDECAGCDLDVMSSDRGNEKTGARIIRTIASDDELLEKLKYELVTERRVEQEEKKEENRDQPPEILVVSEWDTLYGRALAKRLKIGNVKPMTYLRGLDGITLSGEEDRPSSEAQSRGRDVRTLLERPEGPSQFDYLRRLANMARKGGRSVKAVGVLGTDVYDKLLVLQALRPLFPGALFFTTDLDARLLHPSEAKWACNLIVASSFGLETAPHRPPFRDNYQTATYWATLRALDIASRDHVRQQSQPKLYEVGRTSAHLLPTGGDSPGPKGNPGTLNWPLVIAAFAVPVVIVAAFVASYVRSAPQPIPFPLGRTALYGGFVLVISTATALCFRHEGNEEPFAWFEGISVWPTELIRLLVGFLAFHLLIRAHWSLRRNAEEMEAGFGLPHGASDQKCGVWVRRWTLNSTNGLNELWGEYQRCNCLRNRIPRLGLAALAYFSLAFGLFMIFGQPAVPARGSASFAVDRLAVAVSVSLLIVLLLYVIDVTVFCERFIRRVQSWFESRGEELAEAVPMRAFAAAGTAGVAEPATVATVAAGVERTATPPSYGGCFPGRSVIRLTAQHTAKVGNLICYPFFLLSILILSRLSYFDHWDWPISLIIVLGLNAFAAIACALMLRRSAERLRGQVLASLEDERFAASRAGYDRRVKQIEIEIGDITAERRGALGPLGRHPVVAAILLPTTGAGLGSLIELLRNY